MSEAPIRIALVGMGKIARDQHLPAIAGNPQLVLAATMSPHSPGVDGVAAFKSMEALLAAGDTFDAVALCSPPQVRYGLAAAALAAGKHVFLEKPPGATLSEVAVLKEKAEAAGVTLFASWHSRYAAGVEPARAWLADKRIDRAHIIWREDVRVWHPGQAWIWEAGGLGVFDPGINALSIVTRILPRRIMLEAATLSFPANREAPIAADLKLRDTDGAPVTFDLDWRQTGPQSWDIAVETNAGTLTLSQGGAVLEVDGHIHRDEDREYAGLYQQFEALIRAGVSDADVTPLELVSDVFLTGRRHTVETFED
ncbi:Gfo/Idh/MocA family protein [Sphingobium boeckii]|uniref:D-galactose 1-dehydrogenase n=1 Tax=Sphingobium boeckii TaxID=1082345 RepID=A0A7W9AGS3_9SPHN|nr:Gfo/Idh/MocA family oxidoreductase [Sphingobium boeckii]MBB5685364.1 D-galactose 1-dehydrogenase [Sphingobium boeckii]